MNTKDSFLENPKQYEDAAELLKALSHPIRLCIVRGLLEMGGSNVTNIHSCLNMPQSTISQHLAKLKSCGIITGSRNGLEITYSVSNPKVTALVKLFFG
ncbi:ArsR/SmtB family transcription factor [Cellulosilyticum sp. I15G10I2]|uniref:ArsR/SmtB family transcription factor n=1 Tax=Cellulosilyticum sp. I15G10I2 TaxID=1892843 RepID=UPI00085CA502|nr:metalloregulator ArsR/SmtB family transcription factor [Cellulosilyticum sp. I15G10I2]